MRPQRGEAGQVGQRDRGVQLGHGVGVVALLDELRTPVGPDPDDLQRVAAAFGVVQGDAVVHVVAAPVTVERGQHRRRRVGRGQRAAVAGLLGQLRRLRGQVAAGRRRRRSARPRPRPTRPPAPGRPRRRAGRRTRAGRAPAPVRARRAGGGSGPAARPRRPGAGPYSGTSRDRQATARSQSPRTWQASPSTRSIAGVRRPAGTLVQRLGDQRALTGRQQGGAVRRSAARPGRRRHRPGTGGAAPSRRRRARRTRPRPRPAAGPPRPGRSASRASAYSRDAGVSANQPSGVDGAMWTPRRSSAATVAAASGTPSAVQQRGAEALQRGTHPQQRDQLRPARADTSLVEQCLDQSDQAAPGEQPGQHAVPVAGRGQRLGDQPDGGRPAAGEAPHRRRRAGAGPHRRRGPAARPSPARRSPSASATRTRSCPRTRSRDTPNGRSAREPTTRCSRRGAMSQRSATMPDRGRSGELLQVVQHQDHVGGEPGLQLAGERRHERVQAGRDVRAARALQRRRQGVQQPGRGGGEAGQQPAGQRDRVTVERGDRVPGRTGATRPTAPARWSCRSPARRSAR